MHAQQARRPDKHSNNLQSPQGVWYRSRWTTTHGYWRRNPLNNVSKDGVRAGRTRSRLVTIIRFRTTVRREFVTDRLSFIMDSFADGHFFTTASHLVLNANPVTVTFAFKRRQGLEILPKQMPNRKACSGCTHKGPILVAVRDGTIIARIIKKIIYRRPRLPGARLRPSPRCDHLAGKVEKLVHSIPRRGLSTPAAFASDPNT